MDVNIDKNIVNDLFYLQALYLMEQQILFSLCLFHIIIILSFTFISLLFFFFACSFLRLQVLLQYDGV